MKTTLNDIRDLLVTKMQGITKTGGDPLFGDVFDYANGDFTKYPVTVILPTGGSTGQGVDTHRIERVFSFQITFYQEQTQAGKNKSDANDIMTEAVDKTIESFDKDPDLGGELQIIKVVKMDFNFKVSAGTYIFATLQVDCVVIVPNY
jgi:hypothetical protein